MPIMIPLRALLNLLVAIVALVALLVGAFEHEDLILQGERQAHSERPASVSSEAMDASATASFDVVGWSSGTEGTFRAENDSLLMSPRVGTIEYLAASDGRVARRARQWWARRRSGGCQFPCGARALRL